MKLLHRSMPGSLAAGGVAIVAMAVLLLGTGCAPANQGTPPGATVLHVTERDFHISAPKQASTGNLLLQVKNEGPDSHELIVVRKTGSLPIRPDGMTIDEEALQTNTLGGLVPGNPGSLRNLTLHLTPGRYELFCNMAGHYMAGMHSEIVVR